ncbi:MAG: hypothetical protein NTX85_03325 [Candidatus Nomurabacteria bacterium]|nr:hypothetical protein [Candidatus Nomurabacteria bacterium]MCX6788438.1 hypothetical protein [Candidatus Jorgensenbacteria bacterium]
MNPEQFEQLQITISKQIEITVNGKIDNLNKKVDDYIKSDNEWKDRAQPTIELGTNVRGFGKVFAYLIGTAAAVGGLFALFESLFKGKN